MSHVNISPRIDEIKFSQAWRAPRDGTIHAAINLGPVDVTIDSTIEARDIAAAFLTAAVALDQLAADPGLDQLMPPQLAGAMQAAAAAAAAVLKAAR